MVSPRRQAARFARKGPLRRLWLLLALAGCDSGFGVNVDLTPGCLVGGPDSMRVTAVMHPSEASKSATVDGPVFVDGHRHLVIIPPDGTASMTLTVQAFDAGGGMLASASDEIPVDGHAVVDRTLALSACMAADGGSDGGPPADAAPPDLQTADLVPVTLVSIDVTPTNPSLPQGTTQQLSATGTYSDNTVADLTAMAKWTSNDPNKVGVDAAGMVTAVAQGVAVVSASVGGVTGSDAVQVTAATLVSIQVTPVNGSVAKGSTLQFTATGVFSDNSTQDLTHAAAWASGDANVATVDNTGVATGKTPGMTTITASFANKSGATPLTVTGAVLTGIQVTPANPSVAKGTSVTLSATAVFSDNTSQDVTAQAAWSTGDANIASNKANVLTGVGVGNTTVTASYQNLNGTTLVTVTAATLTSIAVAPPMPSLAKGTTAQLTATGTYSDNSTQDLTTQATWASATPTIATVSNANGSQGLVTAVSPGGPINVTATVGNVAGAAQVTVTAAILTAIAVKPATATIHSQTTVQLTATGTYSDNSTQDLTTQVAWTSSDDASATVNNTAGRQGIVTGLAVKGNVGVTITASLMNVSGTAAVTVDGAALTSITVTPANQSIPRGTTQQYTATGGYADATLQNITNDVTWSSSSGNTIFISNSFGTIGLAKALNFGNPVTIAATKGNVVGSTTATVGLPVLTSVICSPAMISMNVGDNTNANAFGVYSDMSTQQVTFVANWASENSAIATVDNANSKGRVVGVASGMTSVDATYMGKTGKCAVAIK